MESIGAATVFTPAPPAAPAHRKVAFRRANKVSLLFPCSLWCLGAPNHSESAPGADLGGTGRKRLDPFPEFFPV